MNTEEDRFVVEVQCKISVDKTVWKKLSAMVKDLSLNQVAVKKKGQGHTVTAKRYVCLNSLLFKWPTELFE